MTRIGDETEAGDTKQSTLYDTKLPFPFKLHEMLDDMATKKCEHIVSWLFHGKAFRVHQPKAFADQIMPRYFKQTKYKSFQRQLHIYGFRRVASRDASNHGAYYHDLFIRGEKHSSLVMQRAKATGNVATDRATIGVIHSGAESTFKRAMAQPVHKTETSETRPQSCTHTMFTPRGCDIFPARLPHELSSSTREETTKRTAMHSSARTQLRRRLPRVLLQANAKELVPALPSNDSNRLLSENVDIGQSNTFLLGQDVHPVCAYLRSCVSDAGSSYAERPSSCPGRSIP